jgi:uncharacterized damage-inducible protein DinB
MSDQLADQLVDTWRIHNRISLYLLDALSAEAIAGRSASKGRSVGENLAHLHNVRLMWLKSAAPDLFTGLAKVEKGEAEDRAALPTALEASGAAIETLLRQGPETGRIKGFKPHPVAFLGYLIAQESHHRGEIELTPTRAGHKLDHKSGYGLWQWGVR